MTATAVMVARVRRTTNEPTTSATYSDEDIRNLIEENPLIDDRGKEPFFWDTSTQPPTKDTNEDWIVTYDLNAAAAEIWSEKAAILSQDYDFKADGADYSRSQAYDQAMKQARYYRGRRSPKTITQEPWPNQGLGDDLVFNINNTRL